MKNIVLLICMAILACSCQRDKVDMRPGVTIACAPEKLVGDEWATLTVFQVWQRDMPQMGICEKQMGKYLLYSRRTEIYDINNDGSGYRILVYSIRPLGDAPVIIGESFFTNVPAGFPPSETVQCVEKTTER